MGHGGYRPGAGRPKGSVTTRTQEVLRATMKDGITPLEYLLGVMRDETKDEAARFEAAKAAAPYVHPKLANIEHSGDVTMTWEDALAALAAKQAASGVDAMQSLKRADA